MPGPTVQARPKPLELALRLLLATLLVLGLTQAWGRDTVQSLLPLVRYTLETLDDHYRILDLSIGSEGADSVIRLRVTLARPLFVGGHLILTDARGWGEVTTALGNLLQPLLILLGLLLALPTQRRREWPLRLALGVPAGAVLVICNTPFALWAYLWDLHASRYEAERFSPLLAWARLLDGGGRLLLGMLAALAVAGLAARLVGSHVETK